MAKKKYRVKPGVGCLRMSGKRLREGDPPVTMEESDAAAYIDRDRPLLEPATKTVEDPAEGDAKK